ncbi:MAG: HAD-IA family hydrolase [Rhodospirillaceae bacterium]|nr:HAD-IA family hydrolase [Rhodospirillaceae bacterium]
MTERPLRLAVFDCDGTLVDSQHSIVACMGAAFTAYGLSAPLAEEVRRVVGLPLAQSVARMRPTLAAAECERIADLYKQAFGDMRAAAPVEEPLFPGVRALLDALEAEGVLLGVATGKGRRGLRITLEQHGLLGRFVTLQTADDAPGKPDPAMLRRAMDEAGARAADTAMIGDTSYDMLMARNAGTAAIGVAWGYHPREELHAAGAHAVVDAAHEIARAWLHYAKGPP